MDKDIQIALLNEELNDFIESMKYQFGENYMENPDAAARIEFIKNKIAILEKEES
ncbi:hypothetical protein CLOACE_09500 [Clostridium acetireducens DSM 10703]|jgi:hypothetical protein|uniref:Uncharacterized protein n=1 Tax=Clostridium acetireducens DSM 10703 TaxID=1121290 RepID=A0A1E8EZQ0_9CLOT|nr:hypothetical protein [Clostridium acetireducens]OFI06608.1 hypothetical protein CLOACE_09500 [Clostridium acetireducens DSM 10703]